MGLEFKSIFTHVCACPTMHHDMYRQQIISVVFPPSLVAQHRRVIFVFSDPESEGLCSRYCSDHII